MEKRSILTRQKLKVNHLGFYSSVVAFIMATGYSIVQVLQIVGVLNFPTDAILIYGFSLGIASPYVISVIAVHYSITREKRPWSGVAIAFAIMYAMYVNLNYVVQLSTVVPAANHGTLDEVGILNQTPHSLFWDVDALGYICMGISTFFLGFAFEKQMKWLRRFLFANGLMVPVISFVYFYPHFSTALLLIGSPWIITTLGSLLFLSLYFRSETRLH
jgi:hypothetical protein